MISYLSCFKFSHLVRVVKKMDSSSPHFSSGIVEWMKCEHTWKSPHARKAIRMGWFSCVLVFHSLQYPWRKMGTTHSLQKRSMSGGSIGTVGLCPVFRVGGRKINFRCDLKSLNSWVLFLSSWLVKTHKIARVLRKRERGGGGQEFMSTPSA